jgi:hypothetical protein
VENGMLVCRSKSTEINQIEPGMFKQAVDTACRLETAGLLAPGMVFQCEYLAKPKHNVLAYARVPNGYLVLFDVCRGDSYCDQEHTQEWADILGLERVPVLFTGKLSEFDAPAKIQELLNTDSVLGGQKIEGVVIKNYSKSHGERENHPLTAKVVSDAFKERVATKPRNPKKCGDELQGIINALRTEARWVKAVGHLRDSGALQDSPKDIGPLMKELSIDLETEETEWIKEALFEAFRKQILKGATDGFPQWYLKLISSGGLSVFQQTIADNREAAMTQVEQKINENT